MKVIIKTRKIWKKNCLQRLHVHNLRYTNQIILHFNSIDVNVNLNLVSYIINNCIWVLRHVKGTCIKSASHLVYMLHLCIVTTRYSPAKLTLLCTFPKPRPVGKRWEIYFTRRPLVRWQPPEKKNASPT